MIGFTADFLLAAVIGTTLYIYVPSWIQQGWRRLNEWMDDVDHWTQERDV